jgi:multicomponent Na+:H+ antiporter subunit G
VTIIGSILILVGAIATLLAAIGLVRFPDVFTRIHAAGMAVSIGLAGFFIGSAFVFGTLGAGIRAALVVAFVFATMPLGTHLIARAASRVGTPREVLPKVDKDPAKSESDVTEPAKH